MSEIGALGRRLLDPEAERRAPAVRREVWKVAEERRTNLEHRCRSVAARLPEPSYENKRLPLVAPAGG